MSAGDRRVRIGGASGAWGDSSVAVPQLLARGNVDYLVFDYLAELTMAIMAAIRARNPDAGYATDFVDAIAASLGAILRRGVRVVANAGGVNPAGCVAALRAAAAERGLKPKIAMVTGDDVMPLADALRAGDVRDVDTGAAFPDRPMTANAYLGALPIKQALDAGADIVVTGRCVDSAVTLGALMHAFGWAADDHDRLARGSLAGHLIECGCQATGGLFTDWRDVPGWEAIGYPIVETRADGGFVVTKPEGTGGLVTPAVVGEQMLYEIGDPARYLLPDVVCDFTAVEMRQAGPDRVEVTGARGGPPTDSYKVCATYADGYKCAATLTIVGFEAAAKARRTAEAILARTRALFREHNFGDYTETLVEVLGAEDAYGPQAAAGAAREVVLRIAATHPDRRALELFAREVAPAGMSWAPGTTGIGGRPKVARQIRLFSFLLPKARLDPAVTLDGETAPVAIPPGAPLPPRPDEAVPETAGEPGPDAVTVPLIELAHGRSGDKGDIANIGVIARDRACLPWLRRALTPERVRAWLGHYVRGAVTRYDVPGIGGFNFVCEQALGGGVAASLRNDPWGKGMAQILLSMPVEIPADLLAPPAPVDPAAVRAGDGAPPR
jgi:hypothetical protein